MPTRNFVTIFAIMLCASVLCAAAAVRAQSAASPRAYHLGDRVEWNDTDKTFGGGWLAATVVDQKGATGALTLHLDGKSDTQNVDAKADSIRPLDAPKKEPEAPIPGGSPTPVVPPPVH